MAEMTRSETKTDNYVYVKSTVTGTGAIDGTSTVYRVAWLRYVSITFNTAPTTSQNIVITVEKDAGAVYEDTLLSTDPSATSVTSLIYQPDEPYFLKPGDLIRITYTNTDGRTIGVQAALQEEY